MEPVTVPAAPQNVSFISVMVALGKFVGQIVNLRPIGNRPGEAEHALTTVHGRGASKSGRRVGNPPQINNLPHKAPGGCRYFRGRMPRVSSMVRNWPAATLANCCRAPLGHSTSSDTVTVLPSPKVSARSLAEQ